MVAHVAKGSKESDRRDESCVEHVSLLLLYHTYRPVAGVAYSRTSNKRRGDQASGPIPHGGEETKRLLSGELLPLEGRQGTARNGAVDRAFDVVNGSLHDFLEILQFCIGDLVGTPYQTGNALLIEHLQGSGKETPRGGFFGG